MKWEYHIQPFWSSSSIELITTLMNQLGSEGWELVALDETERAIFKRPVQEEPQKPNEPRKTKERKG